MNSAWKPGGKDVYKRQVDTRTGAVTLLKHWCVEDCGTVINPQLVDEQIRGGIVQGIGAVLFEHCLYDDAGQFLNATMRCV